MLKLEIDDLQGGFSDELYYSDIIQDYIRGKVTIYGWLGHEFRRDRLDKYIERKAEELGYNQEEIAEWLISKSARKFADDVCHMDLESVKDYFLEWECKYSLIINY